MSLESRIEREVQKVEQLEKQLKNFQDELFSNPHKVLAAIKRLSNAQIALENLELQRINQNIESLQWKYDKFTK